MKSPEIAKPANHFTIHFQASALAKRPRPTGWRPVIATVELLAVATACLFSCDAAAAAGLVDEIRPLHAAARLAVADGDWSKAERLRRQRDQIVKKYATADDAELDEQGQAWAAAYQAIEAVVGTGPANPGPVNELNYKAACDRLLAAWEPFADDDCELVYGDVAVRLFKVVQQARNIYPDVLTPGTDHFVIDQATLTKIVTRAAEADPCQPEARAVRCLLTPYSPKDTFLRLEVREDLAEAVRELTSLSRTRTDSILPWHGLVEFAKGHKSLSIATERHNARLLEPDYFARGFLQPGHIVEGHDSRNRPFRLFYGRFILAEALNTAGDYVPAIMALKPDGNWSRHYVRLLYRHPVEQEQAYADVAFMEQLLRRFSPEKSWKIGPQRFSLFHFPIEEATLLLERQTLPLVVEHAAGLVEPDADQTKIDPDFLLRQLDTNPFPSHQAAVQEITRIRRQRAGLSHPLVSLTSMTLPRDPLGEPPESIRLPFNPLIIVSRDDEAEGSPLFFGGEKDDPPYLQLLPEAGRPNGRLEFHADQQEFAIRYPGFKAHLPLSFTAIPAPVLAATEAGWVLSELLKDAGYSSDEVEQELVKSCVDRGYVPDLVKKMIRTAKQNYRVSDRDAAIMLLSQKGWRYNDPEKYLNQLGEQMEKRAERREKNRQETAAGRASSDNETIDPVNWSELSEMRDHFLVSREQFFGRQIRPYLPGDDMEANFREFGFRYLTTERREFLMHRGLSNRFETRVSRFADADNRNDSFTRHLLELEFRYADGRTPIDDSVHYTTSDYDAIERNLSGLFYPSAVAFHPCIPAISDALDALEIASESTATVSWPSRPLQPWQLGQDPDAVGDPARREKIERTIDAVNALFIDYGSFLLRGYQSITPTALRKRLAKVRKASADDRAEISEGFLPVDTLLALQAQVARDDAAGGIYHRSLALYGDAIDLLNRKLAFDLLRLGQFSLLQSVPEPQQVSRFAADLELFLSDEKFAIILQTEQAITLKLAGLDEAATHIFRRLFTEVNLTLLPIVTTATDYINAYGLQTPESVRRHVAFLKEHANLLKSLCPDLLQFAVRRAEAVAEQPDDAACLEIHAEIEGLGLRLNAATRAAAQEAVEQAETPNKTLAEIRGLFEKLRKLKPSFSVWVRSTQLKIKYLPETLYETGQDKNTIPMAVPDICPVAYDLDRGFTIELAELVTAERAAAVLRSGDDAKDPPSGAELARQEILLAWYWIDQKNFDAATASLLRAAFAFHEQSQRRGNAEQTETLLADWNHLILLVATGCFWQPPPAVSDTFDDYLDLLKLQCTMWERKWFALGLDPTHARIEEGRLVKLIQTGRELGKIRRANRLADESQKIPRTYQQDYEFRVGPIPDVLVREAVLTQKIYESELGKQDFLSRGTRQKFQEEFEAFLTRTFPRPAEVNPEIIELLRDRNDDKEP